MSENEFDPSKLDIDFSKIDDLMEEEKKQKDEKKKEIDEKTTNEGSENIINKDNENTNKNEYMNKEDTKEGKLLDTNKTQNDSKKEDIKEQDNIDDILSIFLTDEMKQQDEVKQDEVKQEKEKIIIDINIKTIDDILYHIFKKGYDFVLIDPKENYTEINYKKDSKTQEVKNINLITYFNILNKIKEIAGIKELKIWEKKEWSWYYTYDNKVGSRVVD